jgi:hypothetical protein
VKWTVSVAQPVNACFTSGKPRFQTSVPQKKRNDEMFKEEDMFNLSYMMYICTEIFHGTSLICIILSYLLE